MRQPYIQHHHPIFQRGMKLVDRATMPKERLQKICQDLYDTHFQTPDRVGVGLAAPQINYPYNIFLVYIDKARAKRENCAPLPLAFWINANYHPQGEEKVTGTEGCYSVANKISHQVPRHRSILLSGEELDFTLKDRVITIGNSSKKNIVLNDFQARLFQHESDHCSASKPCFYFNYLNDGLADVKDFQPQAKL